MKQVTRAAAPAVQAVKQAAAPVSQAARSAQHVATSTAGATVTSAAKSLPVGVPQAPPPPRVVPQAAVTVAHEATATVRQAVEETIEAADAVGAVETVEVVTDVAPMAATAHPRQEPVVPTPPVARAAAPDEPQTEEAPPAAVVAAAPNSAVLQAPAPPPADVVEAEDPPPPEPPDTPFLEDTHTGAVVPLGDAVVAIHDRARIRAVSTAIAIAEWADIAAVDRSEANAPPRSDNSAAVIETRGQPGPAAAPANVPARPTEPSSTGTTTLPGSLGLASSAVTGWLDGLAALPLRELWASLLHTGRNLPSVIVLPNLAPPG